MTTGSGIAIITVIFAPIWVAIYGLSVYDYQTRRMVYEWYCIHETVEESKYFTVVSTVTFEGESYSCSQHKIIKP